MPVKLHRSCSGTVVFAARCCCPRREAAKRRSLRDLVRQLSCGDGIPPQRITLVDERGEVAVMYRGQPQMDVGPRTDVLDGCPKALAIPMALRAMNPQIIAVDEITVREDLQAMTQAAGCGVALLATIHAADAAELEQKPLYRELLANRVFRQAVRIRVTAGGPGLHGGGAAMMKLLGSLCVFAAGGMVWWSRRQERQKKRRLLSDLIAALGRMETEIRLARMPLPRLLERLAEGRGRRNASLFFRTLSEDWKQGRPPAAAWRPCSGGTGPAAMRTSGRY